MAVRGKKIQKVAGWLSLVILLLFIAAIAITWIRMPEYFIKNLAAFADKKSEGFYALSIGGMERGLFPPSVKFNEVKLTPARRSTKGKNGEQKVYSFSASEIEITGIDVISMYKNREFACKKLRIVKPEIKTDGEDVLSTDSLQLATNLAPKIRPLFDYVRTINISKIELEKANFDFLGTMGYSNLISQADNVSIDVLGFRTDSAMFSRQNRMFETDDVFFRMNDFRNVMGDSVHVLTIDTLLYSLKTTDIKASGFNLFPLSGTPQKNLFEVTVPDVYIKSGNNPFALRDSLKIRFLEFKNPEIKFFQKENPEELNMEDINNFDLYALVQNRFISLEIDTFFLLGAHLKIFRQPDIQNYRQQFSSINITLNGFALDSASAQNKEKLLHADDLEMQVAGYHLRLEDDEHHFRADSLFVSTFSDKLGLKNIHLHPENKKESGSRTEVNIECAELNIEEVDLRNLYHTRALPTSKIELIEPNVHLLYHLEKAKRKKQGETGLLFEVVTDYLKGVYANLVYIENGRLDIKNQYHGHLQGYFETRFNFSLTDFSLDSASVQRTDKFFYATNFDLRFSDYHMRLVDDLHKINVENVTVSSINQQIQLENLHLQPVINHVTLAKIQDFDRSELFEISVPKINLTGVDLRNAFFNKKLSISNFSISNPDIYFENFGTLRDGKKKMELTEFYQLIFNYIEDFDIKRFTVPDGKLTWVNHTRRGRTTSFDNDFSASLENFRLNETELSKDRLLFSDNFDVTIKDQEFQLSDSVHVLKGSEIKLSSASSSVTVKDAHLFPLITSKKYADLATTFQVAIPELKIEGFDFQKGWYTQEPEIRSLELVSPRFQIYTRKNKAKPLDLNTYRFPLPPFVESFHLNELKITRGEAITYQTVGINQRPQAHFYFDFFMPGVFLKNNPQNQIELTSDNIELNISGFRAPIDESHNLSIEKIDFNRAEKAISVSNLKVNPLSSGGNQFFITAPKINFFNFNLNAALNDNNFEFDGIEINNPQISIEINRELTGDTLEFLQTLDLYPYAERFVNQVKVGNLNLNNVNLHFNWLEKQLFNNRINIRFKDILMGENQPPANLLNSSEFEISTTRLSTKTNDGLYEFTADSFIYNSARHQVLLKNIDINPLIDKESFPLRKGFQTDVVNANIRFIELLGINEKRWLQENTLDAAKLKAGPATVNIFRNKRFPLDPDQRPPWPQDLIKNLQQPFVFDSVILLPSSIRYSELMGISDEPGSIEFNDLTLRGGKFSNIKKELENHGHFELDARARLLNEGLLSVRFRFDLTSPEYKHSATGSLGPMSLAPLNSMVSKSAPLAIEDGQLNRFEFDLTFNETRGEGLLYFGYDNLKIAVLDYSGDQVQKAKLASFLANKMSLHSKNPKGNDLEPVEISWPRDEKRSVINFWWKSLYSGAREVLGLEP